MRADPRRPGRYQVWDPHAGRWIDKGKGWAPEAAKQVGIGAALAIAGRIILRVVPEIPWEVAF